MADDLKLKEQIETNLQKHNRRRVGRIHVQVDAGVAVLKGEVGSYYEKQLALDSCRKVTGVVETIDRIEVSMAA